MSKKLIDFNPELLKQIDQVVKDHGYESRNEFVRDACRRLTFILTHEVTGTKLTNQKRKEGSAEVQKMYSLYKKGISTETIAKTYNISSSTVIRRFNQEGIYLTRKMSEKEKQEALKLYKSGLSCKSVANRLGYNPSTIHELVKKAGINRSVKEANSKPNSTWRNSSDFRNESNYRGINNGDNYFESDFS